MSTAASLHIALIALVLLAAIGGGLLAPAAFVILTVLLMLLLRGVWPPEVVVSGTLLLLAVGSHSAPRPFLSLEDAVAGLANPGGVQRRFCNRTTELPDSISPRRVTTEAPLTLRTILRIVTASRLHPQQDTRLADLAGRQLGAHHPRPSHQSTPEDTAKTCKPCNVEKTYRTLQAILAPCQPPKVDHDAADTYKSQA